MRLALLDILLRESKLIFICLICIMIATAKLVEGLLETRWLYRISLAPGGLLIE